MTYPVKYMVVPALIGWNVIDTSVEGKGKTVKWFLGQLSAHHSAGALNRQEGYRYVY